MKKAFDAVLGTESVGDSRRVFTDFDAIARFGVGKNMVASMRHWSTVTGIIEDMSGENRIATTRLGRLIFGSEGLDPYMEHPAMAWLLHWNLCGRDTKTTWFWAFHYYPAGSFERDMLVRGIEKLAEDRKWPRASVATIRRDVSCFIRTYVAQSASGQGSYKDGLESPLTELGIIKLTGRRDGFRFARGPKPSLGPGVFGYAVTDFRNRYFGNANTLSFEALTHEPVSPGRVFLLEENDMVDLLVALEEASKGIYSWSETAGLKQVIRNRVPTDTEALALIKQDSPAILHHELQYAVG